ncbi:hypothetical protein D3C79_1085790 [compost metagenome]
MDFECLESVFQSPGNMKSNLLRILGIVDQRRVGIDFMAGIDIDEFPQRLSCTTCRYIPKSDVHCG